MNRIEGQDPNVSWHVDDETIGVLQRVGRPAARVDTREVTC